MKDNLSSAIEESTLLDKLYRFLHKEPAGGILLGLAAALALIIANSPLEVFYNKLIDLPLLIQIGNFSIGKPLLLWVNDGLMAVFFFLIGLELKREFLEGTLSDKRLIVLPALGALGGILLPALIYAALNYDNPDALSGWAVPAATDIAFSLGVLALLRKHLPLSLKILLTSIAIFDDLGAIIIIAIFYTSQLSMLALGIAAICCTILFIFNSRNATHRSFYILIGIIMWAALLKSGVHATLSGIVLAMFIPMTDPGHPDEDHSPLKTLEHDLHDTVSFFILPIFAFCNAGVNLAGAGLETLLHPITLGVTLGLFIGKQIGVFALCWLGIKSGLAKMPQGASWIHIYGISVLCGIGFTMSLFISSLAFENVGAQHFFDARVGTIVGSLLSGLWGYAVLRYSIRNKK